MNLDPNPAPAPASALSVHDFQDIFKIFCCYFFSSLLLFEGTFTSFFKDKDYHNVIKKPTNSLYQCFPFLLDDGRIRIRISD
jgi:hypothetical protein